ASASWGAGLDLAHPHPVDEVICALAHHQAGPDPGWQDVLHEVRQVHRLPDLTGYLGGLRVTQSSEVVEVRIRILEGSVLQPQESGDVPVLDVLDPCVDVDGEVEEVADHEGGASLQHVEPLDNENVGLVDDL